MRRKIPKLPLLATLALISPAAPASAQAPGTFTAQGVVLSVSQTELVIDRRQYGIPPLRLAVDPQVTVRTAAGDPAKLTDIYAGIIVVVSFTIESNEATVHQIAILPLAPRTITLLPRKTLTPTLPPGMYSPAFGPS